MAGGHRPGFPRLLLALLAMLCCGAGPWGQTGTTVKVYPCPPGTAAASADRLRAEFGLLPGFQIAADQRTAQIVVRAPEETHVQIGRRLAALGPGSVAPAPPNGPPALTMAAPPGATPQKPPYSRSATLRSTTPEQFEAGLLAALGNRLSAVGPGGPQARRYRLALPGGASVDLTIQPAARLVIVEGAPAAVEASARLIQVLDSPSDNHNLAARLVSLGKTHPASIQRAAAAIGSTPAGPLPGPAIVAELSQARQPGPPSPPPSAAPGPPARGAPGAPQGRAGLVSPVQIEMLDGLDVVVIHGNRRDVDQVVEIINQIEQLSIQTVPAIEVYQLRHADCQAMGMLIRSVYDEVYLVRQGSVSITPLIKPNAILVVGRRENVQTVLDLVGRLDEPVAPDAQFQVFPLRHATPAAVQAAIQEFYADRGALGPWVRTTIDIRSNSLFVQACPRDMAEVAEMVRRIDTPTGAAVNELRVIELEHSLAPELAAIMQSAIGAATSSTGMPGAGMLGPGMQSQMGIATQVPVGVQPPGAARPIADQRSVMLRFLTTDAQGRRLVSSGILGDVRITADARANALVVSAPAECIELIEALIHQLDKLPSAEAQIKVFSVVNGDATNLAEMLRTMFGGQAGPTQVMTQTAAGSGENSLVGLRFAVDSRTNSIIASGAMGDLNVVEAILTRLDDSDVRHRQSVIFRLKNSPARDVADAINTFLRTERQVQQVTPGLTSPFEQLEREVVVVPEPVSNSLILSATPRFFEEIRGLIEQLDARPPMVMIQVLIAEVALGNTDEFGIELGLQDSILFDRSLLSSGELKPGFNFNNQPLGNSGSDLARQGAGNAAGQGLSSFSLGRVNGPLGFGGLVLSAASENVSVLLRALSECHRVDVLQRPQVMTLDNQPAFIQVGQRVPQITGTQVNEAGQSNSINLINVGLILAVTPRISPDGLVVMEIDAERSDIGPEAEGIPVAISEGQVIRSPRINTTTAQTTVSATSGQTVILGGLISKTKNQQHRKVPWLGDVPVLGRLFRFDSESTTRQELLIIMTPHIVRSEADAEAIKQAATARMNWCLCDVTEVYGEAGLRKRSDEWADSEVQTVYPDQTPQSPAGPARAGQPGGPEIIPVPAGTPEDRPASPSMPALPSQPRPMEPPQPSARSGSQRWLGRPQFAPVEGPGAVATGAYQQAPDYQYR